MSILRIALSATASALSVPALAATGLAPDPVTSLSIGGIPVDFILFALTLLLAACAPLKPTPPTPAPEKRYTASELLALTPGSAPKAGWLTAGSASPVSVSIRLSGLTSR